LTNATTDVMRI